MIEGEKWERGRWITEKGKAFPPVCPTRIFPVNPPGKTNPADTHAHRLGRMLRTSIYQNSSNKYWMSIIIINHIQGRTARRESPGKRQQEWTGLWPFNLNTGQYFLSYHQCVCSFSTSAPFPATAAVCWRKHSLRWGPCSPVPLPASLCPDAWWSPPGATEQWEEMGYLGEMNVSLPFILRGRQFVC